MLEKDEFDLKLKEQRKTEQEKDMKKYLESLIHQSPLMLFLTGTPEKPQCRFTKELMNIFTKLNITDYETFDILQDENVQEKLKEYSSWPTYPQIYLNGQLIGGLDIVKQMYEDGTLVQTLTERQGLAV
jgi:Grx4 family monothiol glutaredoxin